MSPLSTNDPKTGGEVCDWCQSPRSDHGPDDECPTTLARPDKTHFWPQTETVGSTETARGLIEGLCTHAQRQGTWGIEYGDNQLMADVLRILDEQAARSSPDPAGLDVGRLARALFRGDIGCEGHGHRTRHMASDHREDAEFVAAEYARLREVRP